MSDPFYRWLAIALAFTSYFGAECARAEMGHSNWVLLASYAVIGCFGAAMAAHEYKDKEPK